jgi:peptidoglycan/LPS O-acetylase OafA/YrhL
MSVPPADRRVPAADVLRALCCLAVVLLHAFIAAETQPNLDRGYEPAGLIGYQLLLWASPLFAVLSGFVLYHGNRAVTAPAAFWRRRLAVAAAPLCFWTVAYWQFHPEAGHPVKAVIAALLGMAGQRHLYFVSMILQFYAVFPLLAAYGRRRSVRGLLGPTLAVTLAHLAFFSYAPMPEGAPGVLWEFSHALLPGWLFYLTLGAALAEAPEKLLGFARRRPAAAWGLMAVGAALLLAEYLLAPLTPRDYGSHRPIVAAYATLALPLLWLLSERLAAKPIVYRWARTLAAYSFAVYLVHPLALHLVRINTPVPSDLAARIVIYCLGCAAATSAVITLGARLPFGALILGLPRNRPRPAESPSTTEMGAWARTASPRAGRELAASRD